MNINGTWQGEYRFEEAACDKEAASMAGKVVNFSMTLASGWLGAISGTAQDDERTGYKEEAKIKGKLKGQVLEFRKMHPVFRLLQESGRVTLEQWAERRKVVMEIERAAHPMLFEGELKPESEAGGQAIIEGTWKVIGETIEVPGSYQRITVPTMGGTWRVTRA